MDDVTRDQLRRRYILIRYTKAPPDMGYGFFDFKYFGKYLIEDNAEYDRIIQQLLDAGVAIVTDDIFGEFARPHGDIIEDMVRKRTPKSVIQDYIATIQNPFYESPQ